MQHSTKFAKALETSQLRDDTQTHHGTSCQGSLQPGNQNLLLPDISTSNNRGSVGSVVLLLAQYSLSCYPQVQQFYICFAACLCLIIILHLIIPIILKFTSKSLITIQSNMADILVYRCKLPTDTLSRAQYLHVYFCLLFLVNFSLFYLAFCQLSGVEFFCYSSSFCDLAFKSLEFLISFPCHLILCCLRRFFLQTAHINSFCKKKMYLVRLLLRSIFLSIIPNYFPSNMSKNLTNTNNLKDCIYSLISALIKYIKQIHILHW